MISIKKDGYDHNNAYPLVVPALIDLQIYGAYGKLLSEFPEAATIQKIYDYCLGFIKKDEVKKELKNLFKPIISLILEEIYPYIYLSLLLVVISFFLVLGIFIMLIKSYK